MTQEHEFYEDKTLFEITADILTSWLVLHDNLLFAKSFDFT